MLVEGETARSAPRPARREPSRGRYEADEADEAASLYFGSRWLTPTAKLRYPNRTGDPLPG